MNRTRLIVYSSLAIPFVVLGCFMATMDGGGRQGFLGDFRRNTLRFLAGDWEFLDLGEKPRPVRSGRGRDGYRHHDPARIFARLDRNHDQQLDSSEMGRRLRARFTTLQSAPQVAIDREAFQQLWYSGNWSSSAGDLGGLPSEQRTAGLTQPSAAATPTDTAALTAERLFDPDHVVNIEIRMAVDDWDGLRHQSRDFRSAVENPLAKPYTYFPGEIVIDGVTVSQVGIRKKGFIGSQDVVRPSLKVKFNEYIDQSPLTGMDRLTLNNNKQDSSLASQTLSYQVFRRAGVAAPRCNFATVTVNGTYLGVYSHVESVRKPFLLDRFGADSGKLYEGTLTDFYPKSIEWFEAKSTKSDQDRARITELAERLDADDVSLETIAEIVHLDYFMRFWAVESLLGFWDGYTQHQNNYFVYDHPEDAKFYFIPWGADGCFGQGRRYQADAVGASSLLANRLYHCDGIPTRYREVMLAVLDQAWDEEALLQETNRIEQLLFDHLDVQQLSALAAMDDLRGFIRSRRQRVTKELEDAWPAYVGEPNIPMYWEPVGAAQGSFVVAIKGEAETDEEPSLTVTLRDETEQLSSVMVDWYPQLDRRGAAESSDPDHPRITPLVFELSGRRDVQQLTLRLQVADGELGQFTKTVPVTGTLIGGGPDYRSSRDGYQIRGEIALEGFLLESTQYWRADVDVTLFVRRDRRRG